MFKKIASTLTWIVMISLLLLLSTSSSAAGDNIFYDQNLEYTLEPLEPFLGGGVYINEADYAPYYILNWYMNPLTNFFVSYRKQVDMEELFISGSYLFNSGFFMSAAMSVSSSILEDSSNYFYSMIVEPGYCYQIDSQSYIAGSFQMGSLMDSYSGKTFALETYYQLHGAHYTDQQKITWILYYNKPERGGSFDWNRGITEGLTLNLHLSADWEPVDPEQPDLDQVVTGARMGLSYASGVVSSNFTIGSGARTAIGWIHWNGRYYITSQFSVLWDATHSESRNWIPAYSYGVKYSPLEIFQITFDYNYGNRSLMLAYKR